LDLLGDQRLVVKTVSCDDCLFRAMASCEPFAAMNRLVPPQFRFVLLIFTFGCGRLFGAEVDAAAQSQVTQILEKFLVDYWNTPAGKAAATNHSSIYTNSETAFREASRLMPERLDLRFALASSLIGQALQTNGPQLKLRVRSALEVYRAIEQLDPLGFEAPLLRAAYAQAVDDTNEFKAAFNRVLQLAPDWANAYFQKFTRVDQILHITPREAPSQGMPLEKHHAIVILGAGLETNGTVKTKLVSRLEQGLRLARIYPESPLILTGGNQKNGVTEAYVMSRWLWQHGIPKRRLFLEDRARDTVENALFSSAILQQLAITNVTLVTSVSHLRRGLADLEEACNQRGLQVQFENLAARAKTDTELDPAQERLGVFRDVLRTSGLWAYPGLQR
jgi:uncharacterized SAM-binding protein YcdF (DUF218 family)